MLVIGTYNEDGTANAMVAAWGAMSDYKQIFIALDLSHKTADNIRGRQAFTVSITDAAHIPQADYVGSVSGRDVPDKVMRHILKNSRLLLNAVWLSWMKTRKEYSETLRTLRQMNAFSTAEAALMWKNWHP